MFLIFTTIPPKQIGEKIDTGKTLVTFSIAKIISFCFYLNEFPCRHYAQVGDHVVERAGKGLFRV